MIYEDHQNLESAYDKVILKEAEEISNMNVGQDSREAYPEKFDNDDEVESALDMYTNALTEFRSILKIEEDKDIIFDTFRDILDKVTTAYFVEGQKRGKEI
jgi:hypothetical protein